MKTKKFSLYMLLNTFFASTETFLFIFVKTSNLDKNVMKTKKKVISLYVKTFR